MARSLRGGALLTFVALAIACARGKGPPSEEERYIDACLDKAVQGENTSQLWQDVSKFAFALPDADTEPDRAEHVLDQAAKTIPGLDSEAGWASAGRGFQAANFHSFERPACARAWKLRPR